jgi:uncharacterized protein with NRDE domain
VCLIIFAFKHHRDYPLIIAANRDEFYDRPTAPAAFWHDHPDILGGRDLKEGGTWLGLHRTGRLAAITNYRDPRRQKPGAPSRGKLVGSFLTGGTDPASYLDAVRPQAARYNGFTLLLGTTDALSCYSNISGDERFIEPGIHGLSNHLIDTPWPKVQRGKKRLEQILSTGPSPEAILDMLEDRDPPPDDLLPDTGIGLEWERALSPLFVASTFYGTCSSTALLIHRNGTVLFVERDHRPGPGKGRDVRHEFTFGHGTGP